MRILTTHRTAAWLATVALATSASAQVAPNVAEADRLFHEGQAALDAGRVDEACNRLRDSQRLDPKLGRLLNLAFCHERQGAFAAAWHEFSSATAWAAQRGQDERAAFARSHADAVSARLSLVKLEFLAGEEPGAIQIDGEVVPREKWTLPVALDPGDHAVVVSGDHKQSRQLTFAAQQGATTLAIPELEEEVATPLPPPAPALDLVPASPPAPALVVVPVSSAPTGDAPSVPGRGAHWKRSLGWTSEGVGVAAIGAGIYFGVAAMGKKSDANPDCPTKLCNPTGQALISDAKTDAVVSTVTLGVGLAAVAFGTYMLLTSHEPKPQSALLRVTPSVGARSASVGLEGTW
jgi:hypothetical protein